MSGMSFNDVADILCDNQAVVNSSTRLEAKLSKKHLSSAYHATRWAVATGINPVGQI